LDEGIGKGFQHQITSKSIFMCLARVRISPEHFDRNWGWFKVAFDLIQSSWRKETIRILERLTAMVSIFCMHYSNPEIIISLMHPHCNFYDLSVCLLMGRDFEMVWVLIFSIRMRRPPNKAFQPLLINEASMSGYCALIDSRIHMYWLKFLSREALHLFASDLEYSKSLLMTLCMYV